MACVVHSKLHLNKSRITYHHPAYLILIITYYITSLPGVPQTLENILLPPKNDWKLANAMVIQRIDQSHTCPKLYVRQEGFF